MNLFIIKELWVLFPTLATIVNFSLMINQEDHTVNGTVRINVGTDKKTYSGKVTGTIFSTGFNDIVRIPSIKGEIPSNDKFIYYYSLLKQIWL